MIKLGKVSQETKDAKIAGIPELNGRPQFPL
jgi:hypothetical protein